MTRYIRQGNKVVERSWRPAFTADGEVWLGRSRWRGRCQNHLNIAALCRRIAAAATGPQGANVRLRNLHDAYAHVQYARRERERGAEAQWWLEALAGQLGLFGLFGN